MKTHLVSAYHTALGCANCFVSYNFLYDKNNDLVAVDPSKAYQPQATLLEAAKFWQDKATGLVFTCEFPHATPADCAAHTYDRGAYKMIAPQMVYNKVDVVFGGGVSYLGEEEKTFLKNNGYSVYLDDAKGMRNCQSAPCWALFDEHSMSFVSYNFLYDKNYFPNALLRKSTASTAVPRAISSSNV